MEIRSKHRVDAEKKAGDLRNKESKKRAEADKARQEASKSKNDSTVRSKLSLAAQRDKEAAAAGKEANRWQTKASGYAKQELEFQSRLRKAEVSEVNAAERKRRREEVTAARRTATEKAEAHARLARTERIVGDALREIRAPKPEKLRVLLLGAASEGDLRVGREQKRIRTAVDSALHRDSIELDVRPAATIADLLDGIIRFRPHIVHFSGHSNEDLIVFEYENDSPHKGHPVTAEAFLHALVAADEPPLLVLLNACKSAAQIDQLVQEAVPFAVGMADSIADGDAINYAAQFYASIANGQSVRSAHMAGQVALELAGLDGAELPTLAFAPGVDPGEAILVKAQL
ncbi:CHAT domain-containing protein [Zhihengliuella alba]|uniref:CHAT domain-containing protein n=1 Tax=Zhihengliuella alba TaxID=547018 RepID=A0ABP7CN15_9MICC